VRGEGVGSKSESGENIEGGIGIISGSAAAYEKKKRGGENGSSGEKNQWRRKAKWRRSSISEEK